MNKILTVARAEYLMAVTSKAFILGVAMMPIFGGGAALVQYLARDQVDLTPRKVVVVDETGRLYDVIMARAASRNQNEIYEGDGDNRSQIQAEFAIESAQSLDQSGPADGAGSGSDRIDARLSQRIKEGKLFAFVIIDKDVFKVGTDAAIRYHSQSPSYMALSNWLGRTVNQEVKRVRSEELGLSQESVMALSIPTPVRNFGLVEPDENGGVADAKEENRIITFAVPFAGLMLMFMMIMSVAPTMLNNVLEEKMQKISEFLISSITPFQLMLGKLLGAVGVGLTLALVYLVAIYGLTHYLGVVDEIPLSLYAWFVFFLSIALIIFGSIFSAIGAACSEIRDAQSLMTPIMMLVIIPLMCFGPVLDSPSSLFSKLISLFPPATPMLMFARIAIPPGPATWEIMLATVLTVLFAIGTVWVAGKIFRIGILSQGQSPSFAKLIGWVFVK